MNKVCNSIILFVLKHRFDIKHKKCLLCEECVRQCPAEALYRKKDKILIDQNKCIECFCCGEACPNDAVTSKWYLFRILPLLIGILAVGGLILIYILIQILAFLL